MKKIILTIVALISFTCAAALGFMLKSDKYIGPTDKYQQLLEWEAETLLKDPYYGQQFIRTGPPDMAYNCHGWTFAAGMKPMNDGDAQSMLRSGRYFKAPFPIAGDIVIYYDASGNMCHSGIVKATGNDKFVLVESKWGGAGRFLHELKLPKAHSKYAFFRLKQWPWGPPPPRGGMPPKKKTMLEVQPL